MKKGMEWKRQKTGKHGRLRSGQPTPGQSGMELGKEEEEEDRSFTLFLSLYLSLSHIYTHTHTQTHTVALFVDGNFCIYSIFAAPFVKTLTKPILGHS